MITIKSNSFNDHEQVPLYDALHEAVKYFINHYCDPKEHCQSCKYRHVCNDLVEARDYARKLMYGGKQKCVTF